VQLTERLRVSLSNLESDGDLLSKQVTTSGSVAINTVQFTKKSTQVGRTSYNHCTAY